jgi:hypothetical protein
MTPEARAGLWKRLAALAGSIQDGETKAQYLADWRARFDQAFPPAPPGLNDDDMLPDGRQSAVSSLGERDAKRLKVGRGGLAASERRMGAGTPAKAGRWAWDVGRRVAAGLIDEDDAEEALDDVEATRLAQKLGARPSNVVKLGVTVEVAEPPPDVDRQAGRLPAIVRHWQAPRVRPGAAAAGHEMRPARAHRHGQRRTLARPLRSGLSLHDRQGLAGLGRPPLSGAEPGKGFDAGRSHGERLSRPFGPSRTKRISSANTGWPKTNGRPKSSC